MIKESFIRCNFDGLGGDGRLYVREWLFLLSWGCILDKVDVFIEFMIIREMRKKRIKEKRFLNLWKKGKYDFIVLEILKEDKVFKREFFL